MNHSASTMIKVIQLFGETDGELLMDNVSSEDLVKMDEAAQKDHIALLKGEKKDKETPEESEETPENEETDDEADGDEDDDSDKVCKASHEEVEDARKAIEALSIIVDLYHKEKGEDGPEHKESEEQIKALEEVIGSLKAFIASETKESQVEKSDGSKCSKCGASMKCEKCSSEANFGKGDKEEMELKKLDESLAKALSPVSEQLAKIAADQEELSKRLKAIEDSPADGKAVLKTVTLSKSEDSAAGKTSGADFTTEEMEKLDEVDLRLVKAGIPANQIRQMSLKDKATKLMILAQSEGTRIGNMGQM